MFVACCNAVIDPLVYAFRNREFYKAMMFNFRFFSSKCSSQAHVSASTTGVLGGLGTYVATTNGLMSVNGGRQRSSSSQSM